MLKTKLISSCTIKEFENDLETFINTVGPASVQYRSSVTEDVYVHHSALVIYEEKEEETNDTIH